MEKTEWIMSLREQVKKISALPFYKKRFQAAGFEPEDFCSLEDFRKIPFMDTKDLQNDLEEHLPYGSLYHPDTGQWTMGNRQWIGGTDENYFS